MFWYSKLLTYLCLACVSLPPYPFNCLLIFCNISFDPVSYTFTNKLAKLFIFKCPLVAETTKYYILTMLLKILSICVWTLKGLNAKIINKSNLDKFGYKALTWNIVCVFAVGSFCSSSKHYRTVT